MPLANKTSIESCLFYIQLVFKMCSSQYLIIDLSEHEQWKQKQEVNVVTNYFTTGLKDGWLLSLISPQQMCAHMRETIQTAQRAGDLWCCPTWCLLTCTRYQTIAFAPQQAKGNPAASKLSSGPLHASRVGSAPTYCFLAWWRSAFALCILMSIWGQQWLGI